jgi:phospholipase C
MSEGLNKLKHIVVLMMENRSFDHMLGGLNKKDPRIVGLSGNEANPDTTGEMVKVQPNAVFQGQLDHDPDHHFPGVDLQIYGGDMSPTRKPTMNGFVKSYATQGTSVSGSHAIMNYFPPEKLPILSTLASTPSSTDGFHRFPGRPSATAPLLTMELRSATWI